MITDAEVMLLVGIWGELDPYASEAKVTKDKARAWHAVLASGAPGIAFTEARDLMVKFYTENPGKTFELAHIITAWRKRVTADVRSARARGLIPSGWHERKPLPPAVAAHLSALRAAEQPEPFEIEQVQNPVDNPPMLELKRP